MEPIERVAGIVFPYLEEAKESLLEGNPFGKKSEDGEIKNEAI